jgi:hypothetical protein
MAANIDLAEAYEAAEKVPELNPRFEEPEGQPQRPNSFDHDHAFWTHRQIRKDVTIDEMRFIADVLDGRTCVRIAFSDQVMGVGLDTSKFFYLKGRNVIWCPIRL